MTVTARDLIAGALSLLRVYAPGEQILDADAAQGFSVLNQMLDSWSNEALTTFAYKQYDFTLIGGQFRYSIGPGGDINQARPIRVLAGPGQAFLTDFNGNRYLVNVVPEDTWNQLWNWGATGNNVSNLPVTLYYDAQNPLGFINVNPVPTIGYTMSFMAYLAMVEFASLSALFAFPPGYERAIQTNLALELEAYFPTAVITPTLMKNAAMSKANVKRSNTRENVAQFERVLIDRGQGQYNIYSDAYNS